MMRMKTILGELAPNSILLSDKDAENAAIVYLQATGWRPDIIFLFDPALLQRRELLYLDSKYAGTLFGVNRSVYMNPKYTFSFHDPQKTDSTPTSLNQFLDSLSNSPALKGGNDDLLMYSAKNTFLEVDKKKAEKLYGPGPFRGELQIPFENNYLLMNDMIFLSIMQKNFLTRKIYFLYPYFKVQKETGMLNRGQYFELTPVL